MANKKKHMRTSKIENWQKLDRLAKLIPLWMTLFLFGALTPGLIKSWMLNKITSEQLAATLTAWAIVDVFASLLGIIIYRSASKTARKASIKNATFNVIEDFDYYREKLSGLSPSTISILMDLEVEPEKDMAASILRLQLIAIISPDGKVIDTNNSKIKSSDKILLKAWERGGMTGEERIFWRRKVEDESASEGYVEKLPWDAKKEAPRKGCSTAPLKFLFITIIYFTIVIVFRLYEGLAIIIGFLDTLSEDMIITQNVDFLSNPNFHVLLVKGLIAGIGGMFWFAWPIMTIIKYSAIEYTTKLFRRTPEGEIASEKIAGMQNFLHDFSNLSEAHKQQLILWDDFLIYAVVLEENRRIIDEILSRKGLTYQAIKFI